MESKPVRRVIVGHDQQGKAVALFDGPATPKARSPGGNAVLNLWVTSEFPVDMTSAADKAETKVGVPPPEAVAVAREQGARAFELRAALSLAKLYQSSDRRLEAHNVLAPALEGFSPTPEFPEIEEAQTFLTALPKPTK